MLSPWLRVHLLSLFHQGLVVLQVSGLYSETVGMRLLRLLQGSPSCLVVVSTSRAESLPDNSDLPCGKKERRQPV